MRANDVGGGWVQAGRNLSVIWWCWERRQQLARCSNALPCDVLGHETKPPQRWGLWPEDAGVHRGRGGIALIHSEFLQWCLFFKRRIQMATRSAASVAWDGLELLILRKATIKTRGRWYINQQRKSRHPSVSLLWLAKVSQALFHAFPLVTHYRLLCQRMPGGPRPCVFTCGSDKARLCASSPGTPQSCWPGPPQPKAPSGLGPGPPVSSP